MKIALVCPYNMFEQSGGVNELVVHLTQGLRKKGHSVTIITSRPVKYSGPVPEGYLLLGKSRRMNTGFGTVGDVTFEIDNDEVKALAAYNAGPGRYSEHLRSGRVLPAETRLYIEATSAKASMPPPILSGPRLFFTLNIALKPAASPASKDDATAPRSLIIAPSAQRAEGSR